MASKNPFYVLGISPNLVTRLSDTQIKVVIDSQYKTLQKMFHPDMESGDEKTSKELNEARESLDLSKNPRLYKLYKEQYLKQTPVKEKLAKLEKSLQNKRYSIDALSSSMLEYFKAVTDENSLNIFNLEGTKLRLYDSETMLNSSMTSYSEKDKKKLFYEMVISREGVTSIKNGKEKFCKGKRVIGTIDSDVLRQKYGNIGKLVNSLQKIIWRPIQESTRLIGIPEELKDSRKVIEFENRIKPRNFSTILGIMTPYVKKGGYVFLINPGQEENEHYFSLDGLITGIEKI